MPRSTTASPWSRYEPTPDDPWDLRKVGPPAPPRRLRRDAGGAAPRPRRPGPRPASSGCSTRPQLPTEEAEAIDGLRQTARTSSNLDLLKVCWLNRILHGPDPLREKLTLFWHGHFATSNKKVESVALMDRQNETLRTHALGRFAALLEAIIADPAMLVWLDGGTSKKDKPNENFAREFLELFTLGAGHYTERDIREAARAFTGWVRQESRGGFQETPAFAHDAAQVDDGPKTFLGQNGPWGPSDIVRIVLERPEAATFLARKLYRYFVSEAGTPGPELIEPLADGGQATRVRDRPDRRRSSSARGTSIRGPSIASGSSRRSSSARDWSGRSRSRARRSTRWPSRPPATRRARSCSPRPTSRAGSAARSGSTARTLLERTNWAADVVWGRAENGLAPFDPLAWAARYKLAPDRAAGAFLDLLLQGDLGDDARRLALDAGRDGSPERPAQSRSSASPTAPSSNWPESPVDQSRD